MFPLIAITAFFILGIAFFAIGKDDFGIKRIKEDSNDTSLKDNVATNLETTSNKESTEEKENSSNKITQTQNESSGNEVTKAEIDDSDLDNQTYGEDDDDFIPTEEVPADESIPFPTNI